MLWPKTTCIWWWSHDVGRRPTLSWISTTPAYDPQQRETGTGSILPKTPAYLPTSILGSCCTTKYRLGLRARQRTRVRWPNDRPNFRRTFIPCYFDNESERDDNVRNQQHPTKTARWINSLRKFQPMYKLTFAKRIHVIKPTSKSHHNLSHQKIRWSTSFQNKIHWIR